MKSENTPNRSPQKAHDLKKPAHNEYGNNQRADPHVLIRNEQEEAQRGAGHKKQVNLPPAAQMQF